MCLDPPFQLTVGQVGKGGTYRKSHGTSRSSSWAAERDGTKKGTVEDKRCQRARKKEEGGDLGVGTEGEALRLG